MKCKNILVIIIGTVIILKGCGDFALVFLGESTKAVVVSSTRVNKKYLNTYTYDVQYKFKHGDKQFTGSGRYAKKMMGGPSGSIEVRYFSFYPNYNNPERGLLTGSLFWIGIGALVIVFSKYKKIRRKPKSRRKSKK